MILSIRLWVERWLGRVSARSNMRREALQKAAYSAWRTEYDKLKQAEKKIGYVVRLFIPTDNKQELAPIIGRVIGRWGGVTVSDASGWWTDKSGTSIKDELSIVECHIGLWDQAAREWWFDISDVVKREWKQDCVMLSVHHSDGWLVTGPEPADREVIGE